MYRFGDVFTCEIIYGDYYYKCTLLKDVGGYRVGDVFYCIWFDMSELKLCFSMDGGGYIMSKYLSTVD